MKFDNMEFRKRLLMIIGIPLGIALILVIILLVLGSDITKRVNQIKQLRGELNSRLRLTESLVLLRKDSEQAQIYTPALENILVNRDQLVILPRDLSNLGKENNIGLSASLGQERPQAADGLRSVDVSMNAQGDFDDLINFLKALENSRYSIKLTRLDFTRQEAIFKALLDGQVFSF